MIIGDYAITSHYSGDYNNPIGESLLTNQYNGMIEGFEHCLLSLLKEHEENHIRHLSKLRALSCMPLDWVPQKSHG